jgi:tetratricopeptide (TPR) repeat protein
MAALLGLYLVLVVVRAIAFLGTGQPLGVGIGIALLVLPALGALALVRELLFGVRSGRLVRTLRAESGLPGDELPRRPSGRVDRGAADAAFDGYRVAVEQHPEDWRAWLRLGLAYDASGDRRRARAAVRQAIALART